MSLQIPVHNGGSVVISIYVVPSTWLLFLASGIMLLFVGFCLGYSGGGRVKRSLIWYSGSFSSVLSLVGLVNAFDYTTGYKPAWLEQIIAINMLVLAYSMVSFNYAVLDRKKDLLLILSRIYVGVCIVLCLFFEALYLDPIYRALMYGIFSIFAFGGSTIFLVLGYRQAPPRSTLKKRTFIVLFGMVYCIFVVWFPIQLVATDIMGWFTDDQLINSITGFHNAVALVVLFLPLITRYNLVKVQLDQVGEGLFRDIDSPILLLSNEQMLLRANPKADSLFNLEKMMNASILHLLPSFDPEVTHFELAMETKKGSKEFECTLSRVYQQDEIIGDILIFHDVTREREVARMKTEFTSTVSHELRTPLTSILGFAKIIDRRLNDVILPKFQPESKKEQRAVKQVNKNVEVIISESIRLTSLINDVLDISKIEAGKVDWNFAKCNLVDIIDQAVNATNGLFVNKPSVQLIQDIPDNLPEVIADSNRVVQVIINLISNAVKFTDAGSISIAVRHEWSSLTIKVIDTGDGISAANQKLVFDKYKQVGDLATDKPKGTGLGLPISKEIVEFHGGRIWVESVLGEGSTFAFSIPLANVVNQQPLMLGVDDLVQVLEKRIDIDENHKPVVLLIDDEPSIREVLKQVLEEAGYSTVEAGDGVQGLELARSHLPDLIIMDVMMPRLNGFDCTAALKADLICRTIPILMLTVLEDEQRAYGLGVASYLTKPFDAADVLKNVEVLVGQRRNVPLHAVVLHLNQVDTPNQAVEKLFTEHQIASVVVANIEDLQKAMSETSATIVVVTGRDGLEAERSRELQRIVAMRSASLYYLD